MTTFDIIFLSYYEPNAEDNWLSLIQKYPTAKRVNGVEGIRNAFICAAELATTDMFWLVDADCVLANGFKFEHPEIAPDTAYVWRALNPVNGLLYGHGGIKLLPRLNTLSLRDSTVDMSTSIAKHYVPVQRISNVTAFNSDPYSTWKTAFRECVKLSGNAIESNPSADTLARLLTWCTVGESAPFGKYCLDGANMGREYGSANRGNTVALQMINDFGWLHGRFSEYTLAKNS